MTTWEDTVRTDCATLLHCPACGGNAMGFAADAIVCSQCNSRFALNPKAQVVGLMSSESQSAPKQSIQSWWGDLYQQWYSDTDKMLTRQSLDTMLSDVEALFRARHHLATTEMPLNEIQGKLVLEIGSGGGAHSALFKRYGASTVSVDITLPRVASTALKLSLVGDGRGRAYQADAERLPFRDDTFDIVYSNGVLHHSENPAKAIAEVHRVLKPNGKAVLMLYARHSALFWANIVPRAIISGDIFRYPEPRWIGHMTEGRPKRGGEKNPFTNCYTADQIRSLLCDLQIASLRKSSFNFGHMPLPRAAKLRNIVLRALGREPDKGALLLYGAEPFFAETPLETRLGPYLGFAWNIVAHKSGVVADLDNPGRAAKAA